MEATRFFGMSESMLKTPWKRLFSRNISKINELSDCSNGYFRTITDAFFVDLRLLSVHQLERHKCTFATFRGWHPCRGKRTFCFRFRQVKSSNETQNTPPLLRQSDYNKLQSISTLLNLSVPNRILLNNNGIYRRMIMAADRGFQNMGLEHSPLFPPLHTHNTSLHPGWWTASAQPGRYLVSINKQGRNEIQVTIFSCFFFWGLETKCSMLFWMWDGLMTPGRS